MFLLAGEAIALYLSSTTSLMEATNA